MFNPFVFLPPLLVFALSLLFNWGAYKVFGKKYALDYPDYRKHHNSAIPQIGGIIFGPFFLILVYWYELTPFWYIIGGLVSILLGAADDVRHIPWKVKLFFQLILTAWIAYIFWGRFDTIIFYNFFITVSPPVLFVIFLFWFVGILNAVNLLDGLDGLAGGFMFILSIGLAASGTGEFFLLNGIFALILLGFLVFNQRPAKLFMGDAGSLFLGFHAAVLPLLFAETNPTSSSLSMTPFVLMASYLVADTTRVFFTRLLDKKSPMTADTIHFHHLIHQQSGSYLAATGSIYFITLLYIIFAVLSFQAPLAANAMIGHLAILLLFLLTPPVQTYVPILIKAIKPLYNWQKNQPTTNPFIFRSLFMIIMLLGLILSFCFYCDLSVLFDLPHGLGLLMLLLFLLLNRNDKMVMYVIQLSLVLVFTEITWQIQLGIFSKVFTTLLFVSYMIFTLERRAGCTIKNFSSLDLLMVFISFGGIILYLLGFLVSFWFFMAMFSIWFSIRFIFCRTVYFLR